MYAHYHHYKSCSEAIKSLKLILVELIVTQEPDLARDEPIVEAVEIPTSMANCCFNNGNLLLNGRKLPKTAVFFLHSR